MDPEVLRAMVPYFSDIFGNPSSVHAFGQEARQAVEKARETIAAIGQEEIVFTSGGSKSDNFAVRHCLWNKDRKPHHHFFGRHHAILEPCRFLEERFVVTRLPVDETGLVDPIDVEKAITDRTILISIMHANIEIGTITIAEIGKIAANGDRLSGWCRPGRCRERKGPEIESLRASGIDL
jgi:cysteine desulfurase